MDFDIRVCDNHYCINVTGEMVAPACNRIPDNFCARVQTTDKPIVIDLSETTYLDSRGLGVMVFLYTHAKRANQPFLVAGVADETAKIIKITALDKIFPLFSTYKEALNSLEK